MDEHTHEGGEHMKFCCNNGSCAMKGNTKEMDHEHMSHTHDGMVHCDTCGFANPTCDGCQATMDLVDETQESTE